MIEKSISAPIGCGIHTFVATSAASQVPPSKILVVVPHPALIPQWRDVLPDATIVSTLSWRIRAFPRSELIVVDEHRPEMFAKILQSLRDAPQPVWLVNMPTPSPIV